MQEQECTVSMTFSQPFADEDAADRATLALTFAAGQQVNANHLSQKDGTVVVEATLTCQFRQNGICLADALSQIGVIFPANAKTACQNPD